MTDNPEKPHGNHVLTIGGIAIGFLVLGVLIGWKFGNSFEAMEKTSPLARAVSDEGGEKGTPEGETRTFTGFVEDVRNDSLLVAIPELNTDEGTPIVEFFVTGDTEITATFQEQNEELSRVVVTEDGEVLPPPSGEDIFTFRELNLTLNDLKTMDLVEISAVADGEKSTATSILWLGEVLNDPTSGAVPEISTENRFESDPAAVTPLPPPEGLPPFPSAE